MKNMGIIIHATSDWHNMNNEPNTHEQQDNKRKCVEMILGLKKLPQH